MSFKSVLREVIIDGVEYGMWLKYDIDADVYKVSYLADPWQWQKYITRNKNKMLRKKRIKKNSELYATVREAFISKYVKGGAA